MHILLSNFSNQTHKTLNAIWPEYFLWIWVIVEIGARAQALFLNHGLVFSARRT